MLPAHTAVTPTGTARTDAGWNSEPGATGSLSSSLAGSRRRCTSAVRRSSSTLMATDWETAPTAARAPAGVATRAMHAFAVVASSSAVA